MSKDWIKLRDKLSAEYTEGVVRFLEMAKFHVNDSGKTRCPCKNCMNAIWQSLDGVERHLFTYGISPSYSQWVYHGESINLSRFESHATHSLHDDGLSTMKSNVSNEETEMLNLLSELQVPTTELNVDEEDFGDEMPTNIYESDASNLFEDLMTEAHNELYPGCTQFSSLNFLVKLMHIKVLNNWSTKSFDVLLQLLKEAFPTNTSIPSSFYEAQRKLYDLGLGYESIHVCKYDCILYWKEFVDCQQCPICGESRYKVDDGKDKKIPHKVLHHFPLIPRLKRLYSLKHVASDMRWHKDNHVEIDGMLRHPADAEGWKHFDREFPQFALDPRNVRLGLASGGFNLFENTNTSYNIWPVMLIPYNLPPWKCMKETNFFMSLLIPGPKSPGKEIDVFLQPLIEELKELWNNGVRTYDCVSGEYFQLHASLLWTINDFHAYGDLSGWNTKGYEACPVCKEDTSSFRIRGKFCFMGHRRYLPKDHCWRWSKQHDGKLENRPPSVIMDGDEILQQVSMLNFPVLSKHPTKQDRKRKRSTNWNKKSIFFELPYWSKLMLRHKLDVMHVEKNICDNLVNTLLNIEGKTKDTTNARLDLKDLGIRKGLHLKKKGTKVVKPHAAYTLTTSERVSFCKFLKSVKFPYGFVSDISQCVSVDDGKLWGLKTHDSHVLFQRLLSIGVRAYLRKDVSITVVELCTFFRDLCAKIIRISDLDRLQSDIVVILCKLEKIFPPAFFDVMIHLAVHLPYETKIAGPVNYSWMYPIGRSLRMLKQYVQNQVRPESFIAEVFVMNESLNFCSSYLTGTETIFERDEHNDGKIHENEIFGEFEVFKQNARPLGGSTLRILSTEEKRIAHWYILNNCAEIKSYRIQYLRLIRSQAKSASELYQMHKRQFPEWFKSHVQSLRERENTYDDMYSLAVGPNFEVHSYSGCIINGVRFHSIKHDYHRATQNSGVMLYGESAELNFYGFLTEVLDLEYAKKRHIILFKCRWFDTDSKKNRSRVDLGYTSINTSHYQYVDEPFIFANQAQQVFYLDDPKFGSNWKVVQVVQNKRLWDVSEVEDLENDQFALLEVVDQNRVVEYIHENTFSRDDVDPTIVERQIIQAQLNSGVSSNNDDDFINDEDENVEVSPDISSSLNERYDSNHDSE